MSLKKDFIVSKIGAPQDGSQYVLVAFTNSNEPKSVEGGSGGRYLQSPFNNGGKAMPMTMIARRTLLAKTIDLL